MVLEKEISNPAEQLNDIAEEGEYENEVTNSTSSEGSPQYNIKITLKEST